MNKNMKTKKKVVKKTRSVKTTELKQTFGVNRQKLEDEKERLIKEIKEETNSISPNSIIYFDNQRVIDSTQFSFNEYVVDETESYNIIAITNGDILTLCGLRVESEEFYIKITDLESNDLYTLAFLLDELKSGDVIFVKIPTI